MSRKRLVDLWHRACPIESPIQQDKEESMWEIARRRFSQKPYSNGFDKRYETVKAELRAIYGKDAINEKTKPRLKSIAINRGNEENSTLNDKKLFRRSSWTRAGCRIKDLTATALEALRRLKKREENDHEDSPPGLPTPDTIFESKKETSPGQMKEGLCPEQCRGLGLGLNYGGRSLRSISVKSTWCSSTNHSRI